MRCPDILHGDACSKLASGRWGKAELDICTDYARNGFGPGAPIDRWVRELEECYFKALAQSQSRKMRDYAIMYGADGRGNCVALDIETQIRGKRYDMLIMDDVEADVKRYGERQTRKMMEFAMNYGGKPGPALDAIADRITATQCRASMHSYLKHGTMTNGSPGRSTVTQQMLDETMQAMQHTVHTFPYTFKEPDMTPTEQLKQAQDAVIAAEKAVAEQAERDAFTARIGRDIELANGTVQVLNAIASGSSTPSATFAKFRSELSPLALTYCYKLVLVGDKTRASLVKV
jgi:hypothetical protein